nr:uncharacterized protein LOC113718972 [Coffea arabica]
MPGRPKKLRRRAQDEPKKGQVSTRKGLVVHCKRCFQPRHNSRTCKNPIHPNSKFYKAPEASAAESIQSQPIAESSTQPQPISEGAAGTRSTTKNGGNKADGTTATVKRARAPIVTDVLRKLRPKRSKA